MKRLVGTGAAGPSGELLKMSKSLNNAIFLSDDADTVQKKVMGMYTDPKRLRATDPGETDPEKNPLWAFHETFNPDKAWVAEQQEAYRNGKGRRRGDQAEAGRGAQRADRADPHAAKAVRGSGRTM